MITGRPPKNISNLTPEQLEHVNSKDWLYDQHHIQNKTLTGIADELGTGRWFVTNQLKRFDIPIKKFPHISTKTQNQINDIELLKKMHYDDKMTIEDIAAYFGVKDHTIRRRLKAENLQIHRWKDIANKRRQDTCFKKYGVKTIKHVHMKQDSIEKLNSKDWLYDQHVTQKKSCTQIAKEIEVERTVIDSRLKEFGIEKFYYRRSITEVDIVEFIQSFYDKEIRTNVRDIIKPGELDVYLPFHKVAIEYNGNYWHTTQYYPSPTYHLKKLNLCSVIDTRLFQIMENEWEDEIKNNVWKSIIRNSLGYCSKKIHGRKTRVAIIDSKTKAAFLRENHLQGDVGSLYNYGLFFNDELVSVMTFGKPRFNKHHEWEIYRYCNKLDHQIVGGASKLYAAFVRENQPNNVISYADRRYGTGNLYTNLGFKFVSHTEPNYWYLIDGELEARYKWQKHKMAKKLENFDPLLSEQENMKANGYYRLYDCGNSLFSWVNS